MTRAPRNGRVAARPATEPAGPAASGSPVRAFVKWFQPDKGYGFLEREDGSADLFCHLSPVLASGHDTLPEGAAVTCEIVQGDRGPQVSRILSVEPPTAGSGPAEPGGLSDARRPDPQAGGPSSPVMELTGAVKFFDPARGFGFILPDDGGPEVYIHYNVLFRSGMTDLTPGQRVLVKAERLPRGLQATGIEPI
ncbi:MAG: cold shock domain-containing protein [Alphaproteobacteria bacterium]|nr:cold shock domain-containing protein [Alphaproteobacteria bacterium]